MKITAVARFIIAGKHTDIASWHFIFMHACLKARKYVRTYVRILTYAYTHRHTHKHTHRSTHTHTHTHTYIHTYAHTHTHTYTHTNTHTHTFIRSTQARTHTHAVHQPFAHQQLGNCSTLSAFLKLPDLSLFLSYLLCKNTTSQFQQNTIPENLLALTWRSNRMSDRKETIPHLQKSA